MKLLILIIALVVSDSVMASDNWFCTQESSKVENHSIMACGVGTGADENAARLSALDNATKEYEKICAQSDECVNHEIAINPMRTTCSKEDGKFKCYRMIAFNLKNLIKSRVKVVINKLKEMKLRKGMTVKELFSIIGKPEAGDERLMTYKSDAFCIGLVLGDRVCSVSLKDGRVKKFYGFDPEYLEEYGS